MTLACCTNRRWLCKTVCTPETSSTFVFPWAAEQKPRCSRFQKTQNPFTITYTIDSSTFQIKSSYIFQRKSAISNPFQHYNNQSFIIKKKIFAFRVKIPDFFYKNDQFCWFYELMSEVVFKSYKYESYTNYKSPPALKPTNWNEIGFVSVTKWRLQWCINIQSRQQPGSSQVYWTSDKKNIYLWNTDTRTYL